MTGAQKCTVFGPASEAINRENAEEECDAIIVPLVERVGQAGLGEVGKPGPARRLSKPGAGVGSQPDRQPRCLYVVQIRKESYLVFFARHGVGCQ